MSGGGAILITGGTGALGSALLPLLAARDAELFVLTRDPGSPAARALPARARVVAGDVTQGDSLGLTNADSAMLRAHVTRVVHCAAQTSFTLPLDVARATNVAGTRAVLDFARRCPRLDGVVCASTVYVAGTRTGAIREDDADRPPEHVNSYERSKHEMEIVARGMMDTVPTSIVRFSTIIGDSATGRVSSFNAVHHALRLFYQGLAPMVPGELSTPIDLIPTDFAAGAMCHLATERFEPGRTYHACAGVAGSSTLDELLRETVDAFERARPAWRKRRITRPAVVDRATYELFVRSVEESGNVVLQGATRSVQAFAWQLAYPKTFDDSSARTALAGTGVAAPAVREYYARVIRWCVESNWGRATPASDAVA
jgi:nucleoside-diphosphate-sugar epimerase